MQNYLTGRRNLRGDKQEKLYLAIVLKNRQQFNSMHHLGWILGRPSYY